MKTFPLFRSYRRSHRQTFSARTEWNQLREIIVSDRLIEKCGRLIRTGCAGVANVTGEGTETAAPNCTAYARCESFG